MAIIDKAFITRLSIESSCAFQLQEHSRKHNRKPLQKRTNKHTNGIRWFIKHKISRLLLKEVFLSYWLTILVAFNELCEETGFLAGAIGVLDSANLHY